MHAPRKHHLIAAALAAMAAATAGAQTAMPASGDSDYPRASPHGGKAQRGPCGERPDPAKFARHLAERQARHLAELKTALHITAPQEAAWSQFAAAMQPPAPPTRPAEGGQPPGRAAFEQMTTPQRIDALQQRADERHAQMRQRGEAIKTFYAQLTPEQQKTFDTRSPGGMLGMHGKGHPGHDGPPPRKRDGHGHPRGGQPQR